MFREGSLGLLNVEGRFREGSGNVQDIFRGYSEKVQGTFRENSE